MSETILIVDDEKSILNALRMTIQKKVDPKFQVHVAESGAEALRAFREHKPDMILLDICLPDMSGMDVLEQVKKESPDTIVVMATAVEDLKTVVKAVKLGAYDYFVKPIDGQDVKLTIKNAFENRRLKEQIRLIQQPSIDRYRFDMIGHSPQIKAVIDMARKVASSTDTPVLIVGETGTGKGMLARTIHYNYSDAPGPFVAVNCAAITHELFESELFGYERGAFTGARSEGKKGRFEEASGGSILLDEIGSMPLAAQSKLLGVLEDRMFYRVGGNKPIVISSRIIAATNSNLDEDLEQGRFRKDLLFRLNVVKIEIPPLRERSSDILGLAEYFLVYYSKKFRKGFTQITPQAKEVLLQYPWPGNVRELRNTLERIVLLEEGDALLPEHLSFLSPDLQVAESRTVDVCFGSIDYEEVTKSLIQEALRRTRGNILEASRTLNMPLHKLRYRMKKLGLRSND
jgi:DNA-binding NtrC family response regulator